jgi:hypothetical protein
MAGPYARPAAGAAAGRTSERYLLRISKIVPVEEDTA